MYSVVNSLRDVHSAGSQYQHSASSHGRPRTTSTVPDKSTIVWKDFIHAVQKRKGMLKRLRDAALDSSTPIHMLKKMLLDIRSTTLALIEDALEIEYRSRLSSSKHSKRALKFGRLPPITSFKAMEDKEDIYAMVDVIDDVDELFAIPNIKVMLPMVFPNHRNPFMLGKTIDELAAINPPHPEAGNLEEELKVLELLRYKRASKALLRAEAQVMNRLPLDLIEIERLLERMTDDFNLDKLFRSVCTILDNDYQTANAEDANLTCLLSPVFNIEAHELLTRLNQFKGAHPMRIDVQVAIRQRLRDCSFDYLDDTNSKFLLEWMELVLNATQSESSTGASAEFKLSIPNRGRTAGGLTSIAELSNEQYDHSPKPRATSAYVHSPSHSPPRSPPKSATRGYRSSVAMEVSQNDYDKTHENITIQDAIRRKTPNGRSRPSSVQSTMDIALSSLANTGTQAEVTFKDSGTGGDAQTGQIEALSGPGNSVVKKAMKRKAEVQIREPVIREFDTSAAPPAIIRKKIKMEVEKVIREMGLAKLADEEGRGSGGDLSSIRYELQKMQTELLRRQVLDPRHYDVTSVDAIAQAQKGLTVANVNAFDPFTKRRKARAEEEMITSAPVTLVEKTIKVTGKLDEMFSMHLSLVLDYENSCLLGNIMTSVQDAYKHKLLDEYKPLPSTVRADSNMLVTQVTFTKLIFSHMSDFTFDELLEAKLPAKPKMVQDLFDKLESIARSTPLPHGHIMASVDRVLFSNKFSEDNVLVDLVISRNEECDGLSIYCTPIAGLFQAHRLGIGPVVINIHDNELEVLLINQHALYKQAVSRWSSMQMLAQWLASRIRIRKVPAASFVPPKQLHADNADDDEQADNLLLLKDDNVSITSQITYSPRKGEYDSAVIGGEVIPAQQTQTIVAETFNPNTLLLLEVKLNRKIQISSMLMEHWKSRNLPRLVGLECQLEATQDLEIMNVDISLTIPSKAAYKKLINDTTKHEQSGGQGLMDLDDYSDDENNYALDEGKPTKIDLNFQLTRAELLIFGSSPSIDSKAVSTTRSTAKENVDNHPESMLWNIMNRLTIRFKGSKSNPYKSSSPASDPMNWSMNFERLLVRDVKTISQHILMISAQAVGGELILEPRPVNATSQNEELVGMKRLSESELIDLVQTEGWPLKMLSFEKRKELAFAVLDKLKVITENKSNRLELASFVETKMINVSRVASTKDYEIELGSIEINNQLTLSDLRILIKHELDPDEIPNQFRFMYKGVMCSIRQETFRRAWECLPTIWIAPKIIEIQEMGTETDDIAEKRLLVKAEPKKEVEPNRMLKGQRRVPGKYNPVPIPTLCAVYEGKTEIYLMHDGKDLLLPGDIIRIGSVLGRDYLVSAVGSRTDHFTIDTKVIFIDPEYDLISEPDFNKPIQSNSPWPVKNNGIVVIEYVKSMRLLKTYEEMGFEYTIPDEYSAQIDVTTKWLDRANALSDVNNASAPNVLGASLDDDMLSKMTSTNSIKQRRKKQIKRAFTDCWIWKCIPAKEDHRPKWRQLYDDGVVHYNYDLRDSEEFIVHYRVKAYYAYLEVLCTDSRCPSLTYYHQRVNEMGHIPMEFYLRLAFDRMTEWTPVYRKGIDRAKFIKLIKEVNAFPDLKRPARVAQLDALFQRLVKGDYGIVQKYLSYAGFCQLVKDTSLIRFPPKRKRKDDDDASSVNSFGKKKGGKDKDDDDSSMMTDDMSSIGDEPSSQLKRGASKRKQSMTRSASSNSLARKGSTINRKESSRKLKDIQEEVEPAIEPEHIQYAYQKFIFDYIMMYPNWYEVAWKEAKLMAIRKEAIPYCASTRLIAVLRGFHVARRYRNFIKQHTILQANIRRKLSAKKTARMVSILYEDWYFNQRYYYTTRINAWIRRYLKRCWYYHVLEQIKRQQVIILKARRQRLRKLRLAEKKRIIYNEAVRVNNIMVFITLLRKDPRNYTKDYGIIIEVYVPCSQGTFKFLLEDAELRTYMAKELDLPVVTVGQIMDIRNLKRLMGSRLVVHKASGKHSIPMVVMSKHALGQKGEKALTRAVRINGHMFVCKIYETVEDIAIQCYHTLSSKIFTVKMDMKDMRAWVIEEYVISCKEELDKFADPPILHAKRKRAFHSWVLEHLAVDTRHGQFKVLFACQLLKSKKGEMVVKIQALWRRGLVRPIIIRMLDAVMMKVYATPADPETTYYLNRYTGASSWSKPTLLGKYDLPTQPTSKWVDIYYMDENGYTHTHYVNPYTGKYTNLVPDQAAKILQGCGRNYLLKTILMPRAHFIKAGQLFLTAASKYDQRNGGGAQKLSSVINLALVKHVVELQEDEAKELYRQAVELSEANPLVTRAYAFFLIGTCPAPMILNRERAIVLLKDAARKDPEVGSFQGAYQLFQFAVLRNPNDVRTLLNLALVQCYLYPETKSYIAEKILRRALALQPFDERVMEIWKLLRDRFPERQLLYSSLMRKTQPLDAKSQKRKVIHGREVVESRHWAGWCFVEKDPLKMSKRFGALNRPYWYNPATGEEKDINPEFKQEWLVRKERSMLQEASGAFGLQSYYDPLTADYFEYFPLTDTYQ